MTQEKLHILFLTSWYPSRVQPINGDFIKRHAQAVATQHNVSVLHIITDPKAKKSIEVDILKSYSLTEHIAYIKKTKNPFIKAFRFLKAYRILLKKIGHYDTIHLNKLYPAGFVALYLKFFYKKKYIITEHWSGYQTPLNLNISEFEKIITKKIVKNASFVCPVSQHLADAMQDFGLIGNYHPVPNVVMTDLFIPKKNTNKKLNLIHISSLFDEVKNIKGILRTLAELKNNQVDFICYFIGGKSDEFEKTLQDVNLDENHIKFIDFIEQPDLVKHLQRANAFLLFSNYENLPCVILEAFSTGIPVIATNVGGISEYFPRNFGTLIPVKDEKALLQAILDLPKKSLASPSTMHIYAEKHFSPTKIAAKFDILYKTINT